MPQPVELDTFLQVSYARGPKPIPQTNSFTFISNKNGMPQVWLAREDSRPEEITAAGDRVLTVQHSPDGKSTLIGADFDGDEREQLYVFSHDTGETSRLVRSPEHFHYAGGWSPGSKRIAFSSNRRGPGKFDVFAIDVDTGNVTTVFRNDTRCDPLLWIDENRLLISIFESSLDRRLIILNVSDGESVAVGDSSKSARYTSAKTDSGKSSAYVLTDQGTEFRYLGRFALDAPGPVEKIFDRANCDVDQFAISPSGSRIALTINDAGLSRLIILDQNSLESSEIDSLPAGVLSGLTWQDENELLFDLATHCADSDIWKLSVDDRKAIQVTAFGTNSTVTAASVEPRLEHFASFDGVEIPYFIYAKEPTDGCAALIYVHGGPEGQSRPNYHPLIQYLASQGIAVAVPNIRGSDGYGRHYLALDDGTKRMDALEDLVCLAGKLTDGLGIDADRIGIMGRSYGGFLVLAALSHRPDLWAAGIDIVGISNLHTFLRDTGAWRRELRESEYGKLATNVDFFDHIAPTEHAAKITAPLLVFHGLNDSRVPVSESQSIVTAMHNRGQIVELLVFENEGHQTTRLENNRTMFSRSVELLTRCFAN